MRDEGDRRIIKLPEEYKEYLAIYTTSYDDSYILEPIVAEDLYEIQPHAYSFPDLTCTFSGHSTKTGTHFIAVAVFLYKKLN